MTYENKCQPCGLAFEWRAARYESPDPECPNCGGATERMVSAPAIVWTKPLVAYGDSKKENYTRDQKNGGHWVMESNSPEAKDTGKTIPRFIETVADQRDYCKRQGLLMPSDMPSNLSVSKDGRSYETANRSEV